VSVRERERERETLHIGSCYDEVWIVNETTAGVFMVSVVTRLSVLRWTLVFEWHQNPISILSRITTISGRVSMASTFVTFCHNSGSVVTRFPTCVKNFDDGAAFVSDVIFAVFMFQWLHGLLGCIRAWFVNVVTICLIGD
jgi:hypothetical protein